MKGLRFLRNVSYWRRHFTTGSALRYALMLRGTIAGEVPLKLLRPVPARFRIRAQGSDRYTLREVFVDEVYREVVEILPPCRTIIDLGANIGLTSLYFAEKMPSAEVFAVEAHPVTYNLLTKNMHKMVSSGRVRLLHAAAWSEPGTLGGMCERTEHHYSRFRVGHQSDRASVNGITAISMEQLLDRAGFSEVDLLKVDVEGAEEELLKGGSNWLGRVRAIAIEFHGESRMKSGFDEKVRAYGMQVVVDGEHTVVAVRSA